MTFCEYILGAVIGLNGLIISHSTVKPDNRPVVYQNLTVSVTFYRPDEGRWGWLKSTGGKLTPLRSSAIDPKLIPYGSKIYLPSFSELIAEDTGSAVKSKKASKLRAAKLLAENKISKDDYIVLKDSPVVDICVSDKKEFDKLCKTTPPFVKAIIKL